MKRTMKRALSLLLSVILSLTAMSTGIFATAEGEDIDYIEAVAQRQLIEDADLEYDGYFNTELQKPVSYTKYFVSRTKPTITVHYKNGSTKSLNYWDVEFKDDQTAENKWSTGPHTFTGTYNGISFTLNAEVAETPIEEITVTKKLKVFKEVDGNLTRDSMDGPQWFRYEPGFYSVIDIKLRNGKKLTYGKFNMEEEFGYYYSTSLSLDSQSYENQWQTGNTYKTSVTFMGKTAECEVN